MTAGDCTDEDEIYGAVLGDTLDVTIHISVVKKKDTPFLCTLLNPTKNAAMKSSS